MQPEIKLPKLEARYQIHALIGQGGAGEVFAAWDDHLKRTVAIKRIKPNGVDDATLANPWSEAIRLAAIHHANIVTIYDMGQENDIPYIVMEHVQGETVDERTAQGVFSVDDFADMARQTLEGLLAAHHAGLIHRDLKPSNIMLSPLPSRAFQVKILDFGMAKFIAAPCAQTINIDGTITGSIAWISPEQLNRQVVDARSDLYSIGCVFYFALSGRHPFDGPTTMDILAAHLSHNVVALEDLRPDLPPMLAQWVMALINLQPEHRYQSAMQALSALNCIVPHTQSLALPVGATTTIVTPPVEVPLLDARTGQVVVGGALISGRTRAVPQPAPIPDKATNTGEPPQSVPLPETRMAPARESSNFWQIAIVVLLLALVGMLGYGVSLLHPPAAANPVEKSADSTAHAVKPTVLAVQAEGVSTPAATPVPVPAIIKAVPAPVPVVSAPPIAVAPAPPVPIASATPVPVPPAEVTFSVHGSNTIGAKLLPTLMMEFLKADGATHLERKPGKTAEDVNIEAVLRGEQSPKSIVIEAHGSTTAFEGLLGGKCVLGMASRPIKSEEAAAIAAAGLGDLHSPSFEHVLGLDGIAIIINKENPLASLTKQEIAGIFCGQITDWGQVGGKPGPIHLHARDAKSGTFDTFKSLVLDKLKLADAKRYEDSNELSDAVAADLTSIGFVGLPFIREAKALAVSEPGTTPFLPTRFTVATEDYLLSRRLYLYSTSTSRANPLTARFLEFVLSDEGQALVDKLGFVKQTPDLQRVTPPSGAPAEYVEVTKEASRLGLNLRFRPASTQLDNKALRDMDRIIEMLSRPAAHGKSLLLLGFTDSSGAPRVNQKLSNERAQIVAREFALRGFNATNVIGFGSVLPVAANATDGGRDKNRRVEVWIK